MAGMFLAIQINPAKIASRLLVIQNTADNITNTFE